MTKLKVLSLFSGIGMFDYGLEQTEKFETILFCEQDKYCQQILEKHWPTTFIVRDIKELNCEDIFSKIDIVTASWPCQGHSVAGKKRGLKDERSGLWKEVKRIL